MNINSRRNANVEDIYSRPPPYAPHASATPVAAAVVEPVLPQVVIDIPDHMPNVPRVRPGGNQRARFAQPMPARPGPRIDVRIPKKAKQLLLTGVKAYASFVAIGSVIKIVSNPADVEETPVRFLKSLLTGTARADGLQVQQSQEAVLKKYGAFIDSENYCVNTTFNFANNLEFDGERIAASYVPGTDNAKDTNGVKTDDSISFLTYNSYLPTTAAHAYLHCYTHEAFTHAVRATDSNLKPGTPNKIIEGSTQYFAQRTPVSKSGDPLFVFNKEYGDYVKFIKKVVADAGEDTLKKAYFAGDPAAINAILDSARYYDI